MSNPVILVAEPFSDEATERLRAVGQVIIVEGRDDAALMQAVRGCDALLVRTYVQVTSRLLDAAPRLRVIARGGAGLENIDLAAAQSRGIAVVHTPSAAIDAVADLTIGLMLCLLRGIPAADAAVRRGLFGQARQESRGRELGELTLGIVGLGRIGKAVARRCRYGFNMSVIYNDIVSPGWLDFSARAMEKDRLYQDADIITLHVPLTDATRRLIDADALDRFKPGALLINTCRGAVVDHQALAQRLHSGQLGGAALDVFDPEPLPSDDPLLAAPNTIFTPHLGARTSIGLARMNDVVDDVIRVLRGQAPLFPA